MKGQRIEIREGQMFGLLTVLREASPVLRKNGLRVRRVECRCECGTQRRIVLHHLTSDRTKSCGCLSVRRSAQRLTRDDAWRRARVPMGERFGRLTVTGFTVKRVEWQGRTLRRTLAVCACACGTRDYEAMITDMRRGAVKSCGCLRREVARGTMRANRRTKARREARALFAEYDARLRSSQAVEVAA